ncbi:hypothetical protein DNTS_000312 [Danionella cerebrum]|uniref:Cyclin N-terminal domain-containing protein n=1 Tax=Danionella cerebrum TaxID=2873325 RepID=A0A553R5P9_9TELE|nr:hypothetical protein DNTS_000312 [Danionella translucida]
MLTLLKPDWGPLWMGKMESESQWWKSQLAADIHQALRIKELKLPTYQAHSPQIGMRRYFADLLAVLSNRYQLCPTARHLAVYLLDLFMDHYDVAVRQLYIIALSCLLLASKSRNYLLFDVRSLRLCCDGISVYLSDRFPKKA